MNAVKKLRDDLAPTTEAPQRRPLEEALESVAADARRDPQAYLEDTRVPEGGE